MAGCGFMHPAAIQMPVADAVEAPGDERRLAQRARQLQRALEVIPRRGPVARLPEEAEIEQRRPFALALLRAPRQLEGQLVIGARQVEFAEQLARVGAAAREGPG